MDDKEKQLRERLSQIREQIEDGEREYTELRLNADKLERDLHLYDREEYYRLKGKEYPTPRTYEETEGELPSIEWLATGFITRSEGDFRTKTREEILNSGTLLEKLRLYYSSADLTNYFEGMNKTLTLFEMERVRDSIRTGKDAALARQCTIEYYTISEYGRTLSYYYKRFQAVFGKLAVLLNRWDEYDRVVDTYNELQEKIWSADFTDCPRPELQREHDLNALTTKLLHLTKLDGAKIKQGDNGTFYLYVDGRGGLYSQIKRAAREVKEALCDFKAYEQAAEEYIESSTLQYTPISILMSTENAECERYQMFLVKNRAYYRSELNQEVVRGNKVVREMVGATPEQAKRAVIPDYYDCKPTAAVYRDCKKGIKQIESENK
jgi:hypothetical protein